MPALSYGLNVTKKPKLGVRSPPSKKKTIFDDDSGPEDVDEAEDQEEELTTLGGLQTSEPSIKSAQTKAPPGRKLYATASPYGDLSTNHSTRKHAKNAEKLDPSIYDYDGVYDSLHAAPKHASDEVVTADKEKKPKYMANLLAASDVRKRDQLRAKEKMLAKEREAEGDEFADKEKFVTGAYKRQQEAMKQLEAEEAEKERQAELRKRKEGGGMKALYKNLLDDDEKKHQAAMKAVEENKGKKTDLLAGKSQEESDAADVGTTAEHLAKETGAAVNDDGQIVDKRQLLSAGLNAGAAPKAKVIPATSGRGRGIETARERESRLFEEQLLGKRSISPQAQTSDDRAAKSRKIEDELLASMGSP